jgi:predicted nucleic acid-binding protein
MPDGPVVANNTPLVALWVLGRLDLLRDLYGEVLVPEAVHQEFIATETALRQAALDSSSWIKVVSLDNPQHARVYVGLDQGEAEVLALAEEREAGLVIVDERKGRRYANRLDIPLTGTLGLLLLAKERGLVALLAPLLEELQNAGLYLDPALVDRVLVLAGEST